MPGRRRSSQRQRAGKTAAPGALAEATPPDLQNDVPNLVPVIEEVYEAVQSLYADELKPFGRILRKRIAECSILAAGGVLSAEDNLPDVDIKYLRSMCEASGALQVEPEEGGDWSALIVGRMQAFVNVYSPVDLYPPSMWDAATAYFQVLAGEDMYLPGGRYSCAQALQARWLPFLEGRSLGQVCHIVQLAISQKKLLGYLNGAVVPYARSQSMVKEQCAAFNTACSVPLTASAAPGVAAGTAAGNLMMATWETARQCLRDILDNSAKATPGSVGMVPLSNVKRLFRSRFFTELSETMLGHSKLSELLQDERFSDICMVQLQGHGYIVVQVDTQENRTICLSDTLPMYGGDTPASEPRRVELPCELLPDALCSQEPLTLDMDEAGVFVESSPTPKVVRARWPPCLSPSTDGYVGSLIQRTFIHASPPPPSPLPNARRRSTSLPKDVGSDKGLVPQCHSLRLIHGGTDEGALAQQPEGTESTIDSATSSAADGVGARAPSSSPSSPGGPAFDDPVKISLRECNPSSNMEVTEPVKIEEPASLRLELRPNMDFCSSPLGSLLQEDGSPRRRLQFCLDEPLALEELSDVVAEPCLRTHSPTSAYFHPSLRDGVARPLPIGANRGARSLPRDTGSDQNAWEVTCQALGCSQGSDFQEWEYTAGDALPTPSLYGDYIHPDATSPAWVPTSPYVPPSPALTASPMYSCSRQLGSGLQQRPLILAHPAGLQSPASSPSGPLSPSAPRQNVICLSDLLGA